MDKKEITLTPTISKFILKQSSNPIQVQALGSNYLIKRARIETNSEQFLTDYCKYISKAPYTHPQASFLLALRKGKADLLSLGIKKKIVLSWIEKLETSIEEDSFLKNSCIPETKKIFS